MPLFAQTAFERPLYSGKEPITLAGEGVPLDPPNSVRPLTDNRQNVVRWLVVSDERDRYGWQHRFAIQVLRAPWGEARIDGSSIGLHSTPSGALQYVHGQQATELFIENEPGFGPESASMRALNALLHGAPALIKSGVYQARTQPTLTVYTSKGRSRVGFDLIVGDDDGNYHLRMDATTAALIHAYPTTGRIANCDPTSTTLRAAEGVPVRGTSGSEGVPRRTTATGTGLHATDGTRTDSPYEATRPISGVQPGLLIFQGTTSSTWWCASNRPYTIVPLTTSGGVVEYNNYANPGGFLGSEAGDAQLFARFTMDAFSAMGRNGFDDGTTPRPAIVVTQATSSTNQKGGATIVDSFGFGNRGPANSVLIYPADFTGGQRYSLEGSLDVIAHEFGHLMNNYCRGPLTEQDQYSPCLRYVSANGALGAELQEGFSDAIGHTVEKLTQGSGSGPEKNGDWKIGEDIYWVSDNKQFRNHATDDANVRSHRFDGVINDGIMSGSGYVDGIYQRSHMLSIAYSLLVGTTSGKSPYCSVYTTDYGCHITSTGIGINNAGRILFHALRNYVHIEETYSEIPQHMQHSAHLLACSGAFGTVGPGHTEQAEVHKAFYQIGYPTAAQVVYQSCS